jgi:hypothetical protein
MIVSEEDNMDMPQPIGRYEENAANTFVREKSIPACDAQ